MVGRTRATPVIVVSCWALGACASSPAPDPGTAPTFTTVFVAQPMSQTRSIDLRHESAVGERGVTATVSEVWGALPEIFAQLEIETTTVDPGGPVIGNDGYLARRVEGRRLSTYFDCGRSFGREYADAYAVTLGVMVHLATAPDGQTVVRTILDAYARDPSQSGSSVHCVTKGSLERRIGDLVVERVGA